MVIYADVLFVVNFIITFLLLLVTSRLIKEEPKLIRTVIGSFLGGMYSLTILLPQLSFFVTYLGKLVAAFIIVLVTYKLKSVKKYLKNTLVFFFSNLLFLGVMVGLWLIFKPKGITINNSVVYFNVSAKVLLISALISYLITEVGLRIYNKTTRGKEIYDLIIVKNEKRVHMYAFLDSGNNLKEPFSDLPVIVVKSDAFKDVELNRVIPVETVSGEGLLKAFKPDEVIIRSNGKEMKTQDVYIALSDKIKRDDYSALINPKIINM